jgi:hypothetical protein
MSLLIESLESRKLLSGTVLQAAGVEQAVMALVKEASQARLDAAATAKSGAADVKALKADLQRLKKVPGNAALLRRFSKQEQAAQALFKKDAAAVVSSVSKQTRQSIAAGVNFILHPTSVKASAALAADLIALQKLTTSGPVQKLVGDVNSYQALIDADLNSILNTDAGDAKTVADTTAARNDLAASSATLQADVSALKADLSTLISAVEAVKTA